MSNRSSTH